MGELGAIVRRVIDDNCDVVLSAARNHDDKLVVELLSYRLN